jgi:hypothetical protein
MAPIDGINRLLEQHEQGVYTLRELFPRLVKNTPLDHLAYLEQCLPSEMWKNFVTWIQDYPLEGGVQIRCDESLPIDKITWLKEHTLPKREAM